MSDTEKELTPDEDGNKTEEEKSSEKNDIGPVGPELLKNLPPEAKKVLEIGMSMQRFGPMPNPLAEKINEKHIDKILDITEKDEERSFKDAGESRKFTLIYVLVFAVLFVFATVFLVGSDKDLYKEVIKLFAVFFGGLGSGFGIKSYMDRNK
ncbi:MAG: hypothetical protein JRE64_11005 [Deltaproteobacteria bacterium]|nr:hypothetical protein [Deltaproteobacteria bacterium]